MVKEPALCDFSFKSNGQNTEFLRAYLGSQKTSHNCLPYSWGQESRGDFGALKWIEPRPFLHLQPCLSLCLAWIKKKIIIWSQTQYMTGKKYWVKAQPCMNQEKKLSLCLSLNTWQEKILNWTSALNELVHISDTESQSQPWKKIIHGSVSISICIRGEKIWKISVSLRKKYFVSNTFKAEQIQKNRPKKSKNGQFLRKKFNFQPQFMTSIHDLEIILAFYHELEWSQSRPFFGHKILCNLSL